MNWKLWSSSFVVLSTYVVYTALIQGSKNDKTGNFEYNPATFLLLTSILKALFASCLLFSTRWVESRRRERDVLPGSTGPDWRETETFQCASFLRHLGSACLYAVNDMMVFVVMSHFDNVAYGVLVTGKIVVVALLTRVVLKQNLTDVQYVSFVVLTTAIVVNQYDFCDTSTANTKGYIIAATAELVGGIAGILNEYLVKDDPTQSVFFHNLNLYMASVLIYIPLVLLTDWDRVSTGVFFGGFTSVVVLMIPINAVRGIGVSLVYKVSTNMTKIFIIACATLASGLAGALFLDIRIGAQFWLSLVLICAALYLYGTQQGQQKEARSPLYKRVDGDDTAESDEADGMLGSGEGGASASGQGLQVDTTFELELTDGRT